MRANDSDRRISVIVAGPDPGLRQKLCARPDQICVIATVPTVELLYSAINGHKPDVVVILATMGEGECLGAIRQVATAGGTRSLLALSQRKGELVVDALTAGARGVVCCDDSAEAICAAIRNAARGKMVAAPGDLELVLATIAERSRESRAQG